MSLGANPFEKIADRPVIDFYASQPLMEACFRVPAYLHNQGGIRRSLQRHAFADLLPAAVRTRRGKSSAAADVVDSLLSPRNTRFIRRTMEGGVLLERGLVEPSRMKNVIAFERVPSPPDIHALISCIAVEAWASKWQRALAG
jgi:asparagine synthase (glutamine-hydrolysing)